MCAIVLDIEHFVITDTDQNLSLFTHYCTFIQCVTLQLSSNFGTPYILHEENLIAIETDVYNY